jgi:hypothetical protein
MGLQARLACSELERPFLYPLLEMLIDLMQRMWVLTALSGTRE